MSQSVRVGRAVGPIAPLDAIAAEYCSSQCGVDGTRVFHVRDELNVHA